MSDRRVEWIRAQLDATEAAAKDLDGATWQATTDVAGTRNVALVRDGVETVAVCGVEGFDGEFRAAHIALHDPAAVLADVEAKRSILDELLEMAEAADQDDDNDRAMLSSVRFLMEKLAEGFRHRDGYREPTGDE